MKLVIDRTEGNKSATQKLGDATRSGSNDTESAGKSYLESASEIASNAATTVSNAASGKKPFLPVIETLMKLMIIAPDLANQISGSTK